MSSKDAHLYHVPQPTKKAKSKEIGASGSLAFTSELSSLISSARTHNDRAAAGRSHKRKDDIFSTHNRNAQKRAKRDLEPDTAAFAQKHSTSSEPVDGAAWARSKRKMEEKARLYAAMKRGDVEDEEGKHMVDFDRKWADTQDKDGDGKWDNESSDGSISGPEAKEDVEQIEWEDEFGRTRTGTRAEMVRSQRRVQLATELAGEGRARPSAPDRVLYGDTVQSAAFNPDAVVTDKMAELAAKRDRSLTPPPDVHFDASREVRSKGVGFMQFSLDSDERKRQMEALERDREETERKRGEKRDAKLNERREMLEERRRIIEAKRGKRKADAFLDDLGVELNAKGGVSGSASRAPD